MKKTAIVCGVACLLAGGAAEARVDIGLNIGAPAYVAGPAYVEEPAPAYVAAPAYPVYYRHRHYHHWRR